MQINFGIVGCGYIGNRHCEHISANTLSAVAGFYDVKPEKARLLGEKYGAPVHDSLASLLKNPDIHIVSVCTPNGLHASHAIEVLKAGKHVLIEKPMALTVEDCEQIIHTAMQMGRLVFVVKQNRFNPPVQAIKQLVAEGKLGKIYAVQVNCFWNRNEAYYKNSDWKGKKQLDGGTLFTQFSHFVDIMYYLFGDVEAAQGIMKNVNHDSLIEFEDTGFFTLRFKNGMLGSFNYTTSSYKQNMEGSITVFAENGTIKVGGRYMNAIDYQCTNGLDIVDLPVSGLANDYGYYQGSMSNHDKIIENVVETLNGRTHIMTNAMEGLKTVEIIEKMYKAAHVI